MVHFIYIHIPTIFCHSTEIYCSPWLWSLYTILKRPANSPGTWLSESFLLCIIVSSFFTSQTIKFTLIYSLCPSSCSLHWALFFLAVVWTCRISGLWGTWIFIRALGQSLLTGSKYDEHRNKLQMLRTAWRPLIFKRETLKAFNSVRFSVTLPDNSTLLVYACRNCRCQRDSWIHSKIPVKEMGGSASVLEWADRDCGARHPSIHICWVFLLPSRVFLWTTLLNECVKWQQNNQQGHD